MPNIRMIDDETDDVPAPTPQQAALAALAGQTAATPSPPKRAPLPDGDLPDGILSVEQVPDGAAPLKGGQTDAVNGGSAWSRGDPSVGSVSRAVAQASRPPPSVTVSKPQDLGAGRAFIASSGGQQPPQGGVAESSGPGGSLLKAIQAIGVRPEVAQYLAQKQGAGGDAGNDDDLANAQRIAQLTGAVSMIGRAANTMGAGLSHRPADQSFYDNLDQQAQQPVRDVLGRRASAQQAIKDALEKQKLATEQAALDPISASTQNARAGAHAMLDTAGMKDSPLHALVDKMSAADIAKFLPQAESIAKANADRSEKEADRTERGREHDQSTKFHEDEMRQRSADRAAMISATRQQHADTQAEKFARQNEERTVDGYDFAPNTVPSTDAAKKMKAIVQAKDEVKGIVDRLESSYDAHGTNMFGADNATQDSLQQQLVLSLKNLEGLRAITKTDAGLMTQQVPHLTSLGDKFQQDESIKAKFKALRDTLDEKVAATARAQGYRPRADPTVQQTGPHGAAVVQNGVTYTWNPATKQYE